MLSRQLSITAAGSRCGAIHVQASLALLRLREARAGGDAHGVRDDRDADDEAGEEGRVRRAPRREPQPEAERTPRRLGGCASANSTPPDRPRPRAGTFLMPRKQAAGRPSRHGQ